MQWTVQANRTKSDHPKLRKLDGGDFNDLRSTIGRAFRPILRDCSQWLLRCLKEFEMEWDDLDEDIKSFLSLLPSRKQMARETILNSVDPIIASGPRFSFEERDPFDVPHPCSVVDLAKAWSEARNDAEACRDLLNEDDSIEAALIVFRNTIQWLEFWSLRFPNGEWREQIQRQLRVRAMGLNGLKDRAKSRFNIEMMEALNTI
jgi:hypothetical protein